MPMVRVSNGGTADYRLTITMNTRVTKDGDTRVNYNTQYIYEIHDGVLTLISSSGGSGSASVGSGGTLRGYTSITSIKLEEI